MIRVLSVASECAPLVKTGGLADVVGALPGAVAEHGVEMRTLLPGYPQVSGIGGTVVAEYPDLFGGPARLLAAKTHDLDLLILDAPHLYDRAGLYSGPDGDWPDNPERFAALSWVAAEIARDGAAGWRPHVVHAHDWQAGLAPWYLRGSGVPGVVTIHNVAFQGLAPPDRLAALRLAPEGFVRDGGFEYWGQVSALKAGLVVADRITTVSPTYAAELLTPEFGMGLDGLLRTRADVLSGILNGVNLAAWSPPYKTPAGKKRHKTKLRKRLGLPAADGPLCIVVSRLTHQKGLDLLLAALPALTNAGGQIAVLGSGDPALEAGFRAMAGPDVAVHIGYDEALSRQMFEGGDAVLVPSRFEPCGLTQLYGLRYGTLPLVALTGGLADTVIPASPAGLAAGVATGLQVHPVTSDALARALRHLCDLYARPDLWLTMQRNAMRHPVGWENSARDYAALYGELAPT